MAKKGKNRFILKQNKLKPWHVLFWADRNIQALRRSGNSKAALKQSLAFSTKLWPIFDVWETTNPVKHLRRRILPPWCLLQLLFCASLSTLHSEHTSTWLKAAFYFNPCKTAHTESRCDISDKWHFKAQLSLQLWNFPTDWSRGK